MKSGRAVRNVLDIVLIIGFVVNLALLTGCGSNGSGTGGGGGGGTTPLGALASGGATDIYVVQGEQSGTGNTILDFAVESSPSATPKATLTVPDLLFVRSVATDLSGQIYVGGDMANGLESATEEILVYSAGATGNATPVRTIALSGSGVSLIYPGAMVVDATGTIYVTGPGGNIGVIAPGANGTTTPTRLLTSGDLTGPVGIDVDNAGNIYVTNETLTGPGDNYIQGTILVFAATADGDDAPMQTITGPPPTATSNNAFFGIAVDSFGGITTVLDTQTSDSAGNVTGTSAVIEEFAAGASGAVQPTDRISGSATGLSFAGGLKVDGPHNIYLVNVATSTTAETASILGFGPHATGNVAPGLKLASNAWTIPGSQIALK